MTRIEVAGGGALWLGRCPGRDGPVARAILDLRLLGVTCLLSLVEEAEYPDPEGLRHHLALAKIAILHYPIADFGVPAAGRDWPSIATEVHRRLDRGEAVAVHCWGGLGRSGMIAARLLAERGAEPADAIDAVRKALPGAIETPAQEAWVGSDSAGADAGAADQGV